MALNLTSTFGPETTGGTSGQTTVSVPAATVETDAGVEVVAPHIDPETDAEVAARFAVGDIAEDDAPPWDRSARLAELDDCPVRVEPDAYAEPVPFDQFDRPDPNLRGLCQQPIHPRDPDRLKRVLTTCDRCGSTEHVDVDIHGNYSLRRDCARCARFMGWPKWQGLSLEPQT